MRYRETNSAQTKSRAIASDMYLTHNYLLHYTYFLHFNLLLIHFWSYFCTGFEHPGDHARLVGACSVPTTKDVCCDQKHIRSAQYTKRHYRFYKYLVNYSRNRFTHKENPPNPLHKVNCGVNQVICQPRLRLNISTLPWLLFHNITVVEWIRTEFPFTKWVESLWTYLERSGNLLRY